MRGAVELVEAIPGRLWWTTAAPGSDALLAALGVSRREDVHTFSIDDELVYEPFCSDFGPLNLALTHRYCKLLEAKFTSEKLAGKRIVHCCSSVPQLRANAAYLACAYQVVVRRTPPKQAWAPFAGVEPALLPFRDASSRPSSFDLTVLDCLEGLEKAMELGWFNPATFDVDAYESLLSVDNIDASWVLPGKFLAFAGPSGLPEDEHGFCTFTPEDCGPIFKKEGVTLVVRLNRKQYDRQRFLDQGLKHLDLYFPDGSCPSAEIISRFLLVAESEPGAIAVHCKAGLGRTCTLIGLYAMKHFRFPARAFIGWSRVCRPGSILGPQQQFMVDKEEEMFRASPPARPVARQLRMTAAGPPQRMPGATSAQPQVVRRQLACGAPAALLAGTPPTPQPPTLDHRSLLMGAPPPYEPCAVQGRSWVETFEDVGQGERLCQARRVQRLPQGPPPREPVALRVPSLKVCAGVAAAAPPVYSGSGWSMSPTLSQERTPRSYLPTSKAGLPSSPVHGAPLLYRGAAPCVMQVCGGAARPLGKPVSSCS